MKKIISVLLAMAMLFAFAACSSDVEEGKTDATPAAGDTMNLTDIANKILTDVGELPMYEVRELTAEEFDWIAFTKYVEGAEAVTADALINSVAHSVVIVRAPDAATAETMAKEMDANKDPRKWICVEAEKATVTVHNTTILLVMSSAAFTDAINANFDALWS